MEKFIDLETKTLMCRDRSLDVTQSVRPFLDTLGKPDGFKRVMWEDLQNNQKVYIWGSIYDSKKGDYISHAYGPHWVYNQQERKLHNRANVVFMHYPEELLIRE